VEIRLFQFRELAQVKALLARHRLPVAGLAEHAGDFLVAAEGDRVVGCAGLEVYGDAALLRSGYTIIELIMVIVVFGVLLTLGYAQMAPALVHARVNRAATVVATDLQYAQLLAVRQRRPVAVIVDPSLKSYLIRLRDTSVTFRSRFLGQDTEYRLDTLAANPSSVVLFPNGVAAATTTLTLGLGGYRRQVRLTQAGLVRVVP